MHPSAITQCQFPCHSPHRHLPHDPLSPRSQRGPVTRLCTRDPSRQILDIKGYKYTPHKRNVTHRSALKPLGFEIAPVPIRTTNLEFRLKVTRGRHAITAGCVFNDFNLFVWAELSVSSGEFIPSVTKIIPLSGG